MSETVTETTASAASAEHDVRAAALAADAREYTPTEQQPDSKPDPSPGEAAQPAETGSDETTAEQAKPKPEQGTKTEPKPESAYTKAQKEKARMEKTWKQVQAEKEAVRRERDELQRQRAEIESKAKPKDDGPPAEVYDALAKKYEGEGNEAMAEMARQQAAQLRAKAAQGTAPARQAEAWKTPEFQTEWQKHVAELVQANPALSDPNDPVVKLTNGLVNDPAYGRYFKAHPDGIKMAYEVAQLQQRAGKAEALEKELAKVKAENERLSKLTSIRGSHPPTASAPKGLASMKGDDAEAYVRQQAEKADRGEFT